MSQKLIFCVSIFTIFCCSLVASQITNIECNQSNQGRHFPSGLNCSSFYTCFNGVFHLQNCPTPLWFDYSSQACVAPNAAECNLGPGNGIECTAANQGRHFPTTYNCSSYYTCFNGNFILQNCPQFFIFVYDRQACMHYTEYDCDAQMSTPTPPTVLPSTTTVSTTTQRPIPTECPASGLAKIPNLLSCSHYFLCFGGVQIERTCSNGLHFSRSQLRCVRQEESDCDLDTIACPPDNDPENVIFLPNQRDCQKYFICYDGVPQEFDCGSSLHWDPVNNWCIRSEDSKCVPSGYPDIREIDCPIESLNDLMFVPHPVDCQFYFICFNNRSHLVRCAQDLLFDHIMGECFFRDSARCFNAGLVSF